MALAQPSRREKYFIHNDLVCLVKGLEDTHVTVDLRNESCVYGKLEQVDGFMNMYMTDVVFTNPRDEHYHFDTFFIKDRLIRYVHIPDNFPVNAHFELSDKFTWISQLAAVVNKNRRYTSIVSTHTLTNSFRRHTSHLEHFSATFENRQDTENHNYVYVMVK